MASEAEIEAAIQAYMTTGESQAEAMQAALEAAERVRWKPAPTAEIIAAFRAEQPEAWGAPADDWSSYCFEWNFVNGAKLWFDIDANSFQVLWRAKPEDKLFTARIGQPLPAPPESKTK